MQSTWQKTHNKYILKKYSPSKKPIFKIQKLLLHHQPIPPIKNLLSFIKSLQEQKATPSSKNQKSYNFSLVSG